MLGLKKTSHISSEACPKVSSCLLVKQGFCNGFLLEPAACLSDLMTPGATQFQKYLEN